MDSTSTGTEIDGRLRQEYLTRAAIADRLGEKGRCAELHIQTDQVVAQDRASCYCAIQVDAEFGQAWQQHEKKSPKRSFLAPL